MANCNVYTSFLPFVELCVSPVELQFYRNKAQKPPFSYETSGFCVIAITQARYLLCFAEDS